MSVCGCNLCSCQCVLLSLNVLAKHLAYGGAPLFSQELQQNTVISVQSLRTEEQGPMDLLKD